MKSLSFLRSFVLLLFASTIFFSCSEDLLEEDNQEELLFEEGIDIETRNSSCTVEVCATVTPGVNGLTGIYLVELPNGTTIKIQNGIVTKPDGTTEPLGADNTFCADIPIFGTITATLNYKGVGSVVTTATYPDGTECEIFSAGVGIPTIVLISEPVDLSCDPPCDLPGPDCIVEICATVTPGVNGLTGIYLVELPNGTTIKIQNGIVTKPDGTTEPLGADNTFCANIPLFGPTTATLKYKGVGSVVTTVTYPDGTDCEVFSAGVGISTIVLISEDITLSCDPIC